MTHSTKHIVETINLEIGFTLKNEKKVIASDLNLTLTSGKLITLIGENGIGKSTLLRTLIGIQPELKGKVLLYNKELKNLKNSFLAKKISVVLTDKIPENNLTVWEIIALGRQPYTNWIGTLTDEDHYHINNAIQLTEIEHLIHKYHTEISDGQLQKVLIARALAQDTPVIILDEPTTHLDLLHKVSVFRLLHKLAQNTEKCILFSTHDIDLAIQLSDEMIVMTKSRTYQDLPCNLIEQGVFEQLFNDSTITFNKQYGKFIVK